MSAPDGRQKFDTGTTVVGIVAGGNADRTGGAEDSTATDDPAVVVADRRELRGVGGDAAGPVRRVGRSHDGRRLATR